MEYTPEQRAIIQRIGDVNKRLDEAMVRSREAHATAGHDLLDAVRALTDAIDRSTEITALCLQHGDLFREFLDTL